MKLLLDEMYPAVIAPWALWHTAGKVTTTGRRSTLHPGATWPWAATWQKGFQRLGALHFQT